MTTPRFIIVAMLLSLCLIAGCNRDKTPTLDAMIKTSVGGEMTPTELVVTVFAEKDPDLRRQALSELMTREWALKDPHLKRYAQLTQPKFEPDPSVRCIAVRALGKAGEVNYLPDILAALDDPDENVRWDAAVVLDAMPFDCAFPALQKHAISDSSADVRACSVRALRNYQVDEVFRTLLRALDDDEYKVRSAAHDALVAQTGHDFGYDPEKWVQPGTQPGEEKLPPPQVKYNKRPWWDWMKTTKESETSAQ